MTGPGMPLLDGDSLKQHSHALIQAICLNDAQWQALPARPTAPALFNGQARQFPMVVDLQALDDQQRKQLTDLSIAWLHDDNDSPFFSALLQAKVTTQHIAAHLARRFVIRRPDDGDDALRFFDPFVFRHLRWLLSPEQMDSLLGPITHWSWQEPSGVWQTHARTRAAPSLAPLRLADKQWPSVMRIADINLCLRRLTRSVLHIENTPTLAKRVDDLLTQATDAHLRKRDDHHLYAEQAVRFHPRIHQHPQLQARLAQARIGNVSYVYLCGDLSDERMHQFASDIESQRIAHDHHP